MRYYLNRSLALVITAVVLLCGAAFSQAGTCRSMTVGQTHESEWRCALPVHQFVEYRHIQRAGRSQFGELHQLHRKHRDPPSRFRRWDLSQPDHWHSPSLLFGRYVHKEPERACAD